MDDQTSDLYKIMTRQNFLLPLSKNKKEVFATCTFYTVTFILIMYKKHLFVL